MFCGGKRRLINSFRIVGRKICSISFLSVGELSTFLKSSSDLKNVKVIISIKDNVSVGFSALIIISGMILTLVDSTVIDIITFKFFRTEDDFTKVKSSYTVIQSMFFG